MAGCDADDKGYVCTSLEQKKQRYRCHTTKKKESVENNCK